MIIYYKYERVINMTEYRVEEYAKIIGKSAMTVRRMIKDGRLDAYRPVGKKYYLIRGSKNEKDSSQTQILPKESNNTEYRVEEYAKIIGKSVITVRKMIRKGKLDAYRPVGKKYYLIRGPKNEKDPFQTQILPEESNSTTLSLMLDKIKASDEDIYIHITKQIYIAYCEIVL